MNSAKNSTPQKFGTLKCVLIWADLKRYWLDIFYMWELSRGSPTTMAQKRRVSEKQLAYW
jgi:hypothetical protein